MWFSDSCDGWTILQAASGGASKEGDVDECSTDGIALTASRSQILCPDGVRNHPNFAEFRFRHIEAMIAVLVESRAKTRLMLEGRHQVTARLIVGLDAASDPGDPRSWATVSRLRDVVTRCQLASPRLVTEVVARLRSRGLVELSPSALDRRFRILKPSPFLVEHDRDFLAALIGHLGLFHDDARYDPILRRDPRSHRLYRGMWADRADRTVRPFWNNAPMRLLYSRSAGMPVLFLALREQIVHGRCDLRFSDFGAVLGISRTAVRTIFEIGQASGLFAIARRGGGVVVCDAMTAAFDRLLAENAVAYDSILNDLHDGEPMLA